MAEKKKYTYVGTHAEILPSGAPIAPGEEVELTTEESHQWRADGLLLSEAKAEQMNPEVTEAAAKLARKLRVNVSSVKGTGKDGTVTVEDVQAAADAAKTEEGEEE